MLRVARATGAYPSPKKPAALVFSTLPQGESQICASRFHGVHPVRHPSGGCAVHLRSCSGVVRGKLAIRLGWKCSRRGLRESQHWGGATLRTNGVASPPPTGATAGWRPCLADSPSSFQSGEAAPHTRKEQEPRLLLQRRNTLPLGESQNRASGFGEGETRGNVEVAEPGASGLGGAPLEGCRQFSPHRKKLRCARFFDSPPRGECSRFTCFVLLFQERGEFFALLTRDLGLFQEGESTLDLVPKRALAGIILLSPARKSLLCAGSYLFS